MAAELDNLLYSTTKLCSWNTEAAEHDIRPVDKLPLSTISPSILSRFALGRKRSTQVLQKFIDLRSTQFPWSLSFAPNNTFVLLLKQDILELRVWSDATDEKSPPPVAQIKIDPDPYPAWRALSWSPTSEQFALGYSHGGLNIYNNQGALICSVARPAPDAIIPLAHIFIENKENRLILIAVYVSGLICKAEITEQGYNALSIINVAESLQSPIFCADYHFATGIVVLGGLAQDFPKVSRAMHEGLVVYRSLAEYPYFKPSVSSAEDLGALQRRRICSTLFASGVSDGVFQLKVSPSADRVFAIHIFGSISVWTFPAANPLLSVALVDQYFQELTHPTLTSKSFGALPLALPSPSPSNQPIDASWWSNDDVVLLRQNGCLGILSVDSHQSRTGESPEWFQPFSKVAGGHKGCVYIFECQSKRKRTAQNRTEAGHADDDDDIEGWSAAWRKAVSAVGWICRRVGIPLTSNSPQKKTFTAQQLYKTIGLMSTTPKELYHRRIDDEEYGEALSLAIKFGLDTDIVYQKQWLASQKSRPAVEDYLMRIRKLSWIFNQCQEQIPEQLDSAKYLLEFGLQATDVDAFASDDADSLQLTTPVRWIHNVEPSVTKDEDERQKLQLAERAYRQSILERIDRNHLTANQKEILRTRRVLLSLLYKLSAFEDILGGAHVALSKFRAPEFASFRQLTPLAAAVQYAQRGDFLALDVLFRRFGHAISEHRLLVLSNIPETDSPKEYSFLLPTFESDDDSDEAPLSQLDWSDEFQNDDINSVSSDVERFYSKMPQCSSFRGKDITEQQLSAWIVQRAIEIESRSLQTKNALDLINCGIEMGLSGLEEIQFKLAQVVQLVYDCRVMQNLTLKEYEKLSCIQCIVLMMSRTSEEMFLKNFVRWVLPFLDHLEAEETGCSYKLLSEYFAIVSTDNLRAILSILKSRSTGGVSHPLLNSPLFLSELCINILKSIDKTDQLSEIEQLIGYVEEDIRQIPDGPGRTELANTSQTLARFVGALRTLAKFDFKRSMKFIIDHRDNPDTVLRLMTDIINRELRKTKSPSKAKLRVLLQDLHRLVAEVFTAIHPRILYEILIKAMLMSGDESLIDMSKDFMDLDSVLRSGRFRDETVTFDNFTLAFSESANCVVSAARNYFDSAKDSRDPVIKLCQKCLDLLKGPSLEVQEERKLIQSLIFIETSGCPYLPIQLRAFKDRKCLLSKCLQNSPDLYKSVENVLEAAVYLSVGSSPKESECEALRCLATAALSANDVELALMVTESLVHRNYGPGWIECDQVATRPLCPPYGKLLLAKFCMAYCPTDQLPRIVEQVECHLSDYILTSQLKTANTNDSAASKLIQPTLGVITRILSPIGGLSGADKTAEQNTEDFTTGLNIMPFYDTTDRSACYYTTLDNPVLVNPNEQLLWVLELGGVSDTQMDWSDVYAKCCTTALMRDTFLALMYAINIDRIEDVESVLSNLPVSAFNYALSLTAVCLFIIVKHECRLTKEVFRCAVATVEGLYDRLTNEERDVFNRHRKSFLDFVQSCRLEEFAPDVDRVRFLNDEQYKSETILGLCLTADIKQFQLAFAMAQRYEIHQWEVCMTFFEYLLTESGLEIGEIQRMVDETGIMNKLLSDLSNFIDRVVKIVYPSIDGRAHAHLRYLFSLVDKPDFALSGLPLRTHAKIIKTIHHMAPEIDYKRLMSPTENAIEVMSPHLNRNNVKFFASIAANLTDEKGNALNSSAIYTHWCKLSFNRPTADSEVDNARQFWLQRYETCSESFKQMEPRDYVEFLTATLFGREGAKIPLNYRLEVLKQAAKLSRQQTATSGTGTDNIPEEESGAGNNGGYTWNSVRRRVGVFTSHLELVRSQLVPALEALGITGPEELREMTALRPGDEQDLRNLLARVYTCRGSLQDVVRVGKLLNADPQLICDVYTYGLAQSMLNQPPANVDTWLAGHLSEAERSLTATGGNSSESAVSGSKTSQSVLRGLLSRPELRRRWGSLLVRQYQLVTSGVDQIVTCIAEELHGMIQDHFPAADVTVPTLIDHLGQPESLGGLLQRLEPVTTTQLSAIGDMIEVTQLYPTTAPVTDQLWPVWVRLCCARDAPRLPLERYQATFCSLPDSYVEETFACLQDKEPMTAVHMSVLSGSPDLITRAAALLANLPLNTEVDPHLLRHIIEHNLVHHFVPTWLYSRLYDYLIHQNSDKLERIAGELRKAGYYMEASQLLAIGLQLPPALTALDLFKHLWTRMSET